MKDAMTDPATTPELSPELHAKIRRMMLIAGLTTALGIGAVFIAIGYRLYRGDASTSVVSDITATLPKGARIVSSAATGDRIVVTVDVAGSTQIRTYDARTLKPAGQLRFVTEP